MPFFSVIIPLYNKARYIEATLASVTNQSFSNIEILVIDDNSTDDGPARVRRMAHDDPRIRLRWQPNAGVSAARNTGIQASTCEWIAFLDADDRWDSDYLQQMYDLICRHPKENLFACARHGRMIPGLPEESIITDAAAWSIVYWTGTIVARRSLFAIVGGFRKGISRGEDRDMWLRLGLISHTVFLNRELAHYEEETEGSLTANVPLEREFPYWEWYDLPTSHEDSLRRYATNQIIQLARAHLRAGHKLTALRILLRCQGTSDLRARLSIAMQCLKP